MTAAKFILVADDDEPSREGLKLLLSRWGYSAETAVDGADALHHAVTRHPALIITDLHMPKMDGLELLRTVQASLPDVPAIVVTGTHEGSRTKTEAGRLAFGYLPKPVDVTRLKGLVEAAMEPGSRQEVQPSDADTADTEVSSDNADRTDEDPMGDAMTTVPEPGQTKCPKCAASMVQAEIARQEGQTTMRFECPDCGHTLTDPVGASSSPSGW